ncbi:MAG: alr0857 family protein [Cyanobacteria bacterium J06639_16]
MLKLTYTDVGLHTERVFVDPEVLIAQRAILALRLGQTLHLEPGKAAFLLPATVSALNQLSAIARRESHLGLTITPVDDDYVEISLYGSWLACGANAHEGTFLAVLSVSAEYWVHKLWQETQIPLSNWTNG